MPDNSEKPVLTITADGDTPDSGDASVETGSAKASASSASDESAAAADKGSAKQAVKTSADETTDGNGQGANGAKKAEDYGSLVQSLEALRSDNMELRKLIGGQQSLMGKWGDRLGRIDRLEQEKKQHEAMSKAMSDFDKVFSDTDSVAAFQENPAAFLGKLRDSLYAYILSTPQVSAYENRLAALEHEREEGRTRLKFNSEAAKAWPDRAGSPEFIQAAWDAALELASKGNGADMSDEDISAFILKRAESRLGKSASLKPSPKPVITGGVSPPPGARKEESAWDKILREQEEHFGLR